MLLAVEQDVKVCEVKALIDHLLYLFLRLWREFSAVDPLATLRIVVDLRAAIVSVLARAPFLAHGSHIIVKQRVKDLLLNAVEQDYVPASGKCLKERTEKCGNVCVGDVLCVSLVEFLQKHVADLERNALACEVLLSEELAQEGSEPRDQVLSVAIGLEEEQDLVELVA